MQELTCFAGDYIGMCDLSAIHPCAVEGTLTVGTV